MAKDAFYLSSEDLSKLYKATRKADKDVAKNLRKRILKVSKPIVQEVRAAALSIPSKGGSEDLAVRGQLNVGLRQGIAAATEVKINPSGGGAFSVRIRVSGTKFRNKTGKYRTLPRYVEGLSKRKNWRHPVFADKGATAGSWQGEWAEQKPQPFLLPTVLKHKPEVRQEVLNAFVDALDDIHYKF